MRKTFFVNGMTCNSCERIIENKLKDKVNFISTSYTNGKIEIDFDEKKISLRQIRNIIEQLGYSSEDEEEKAESDNNEKVDYTKWIVLGGTAILVIISILYLTGWNILTLKIPDLQIPQFGQSTSLILLFLIGFLIGFHCISMCGGFVVSYTAKNATLGHKSFIQHLFYGGGKVISYTIIGGIFGLIGGIFAFSAGFRGWVAIIAGLFMIFYALSMFGLKFFRRFQFNPKFLTRFTANMNMKSEGFYMRPAITGLLNGLFIACGPLQAMYLFAAGSGNFFIGAMSLFAFGLGTLPVMLGFGSLATVISHKTTKRILKVSAVIVLILGLVMINRGLALTGSTIGFSSFIPLNTNSNLLNNSQINIVEGYQIINMDVDSSGYSPNSFVLKQGVPVKWNVNVKELTGCNQELVANAYGIDKKLQTGLNVIEFTPNKEGTIAFSCGMGMLRGNFIVTNNGSASTQQIQAATPSKSSSCSMGANGGSCGCGG